MPEAVASGDTIHALATGAAAAAIAVVRVSGPQAHEMLRTLAGDVPPMRLASVRVLRGPDGEMLDEALVIAFAERASFTGEAMVEMQCHGGRAVVLGIIDMLERLGSRIADPGEFTRRAVLAGRMDLVAAEGLGDLVAAETGLQRREALRALGGGASARIGTWRDTLVAARALLEVTIDWADEEVPEDVVPDVAGLLDPVLHEMQAAVDGVAMAERIREGFEVALVGPPNVGKSSLLNAIAGRDAAIVTDVPGTTRDVLEVRYDLAGVPVTFLDTAGLRESTDPVESEGVRRAQARAAAADLRLHLRSVDTAAEMDALRQLEDLVVWSKVDIQTGPGDLAISAVTGAGVSALLDKVGTVLSARVARAGLLGHRRQAVALTEALEHATACRQGLGIADIETSAESLRSAMQAVDRLTGRHGVEDVLDQVFSRFCLGK